MAEAGAVARLLGLFRNFVAAADVGFGRVVRIDRACAGRVSVMARVRSCRVEALVSSWVTAGVGPVLRVEARRRARPKGIRFSSYLQLNARLRSAGSSAAGGQVARVAGVLGREVHTSGSAALGASRTLTTGSVLGVCAPFKLPGHRRVKSHTLCSAHMLKCWMPWLRLRTVGT